MALTAGNTIEEVRAVLDMTGAIWGVEKQAMVCGGPRQRLQLKCGTVALDKSGPQTHKTHNSIRREKKLKSIGLLSKGLSQPLQKVGNFPFRIWLWSAAINVPVGAMEQQLGIGRRHFFLKKGASILLPLSRQAIGTQASAPSSTTWYKAPPRVAGSPSPHW